MTSIRSAARSVSSDKATATERAEFRPKTVKTPAVLYHWASYASIGRLGQTPESGQVPLKRISSSLDLAVLCPSLSGRPGLFTWTDPITGACANLTEMYAKPGDAVLLKLTIKAEARVVELCTYGDDEPVRPDLTGADIVLHRRYIGPPEDPGPPLFQEYVVLNPSAVGSFSANPRELAAELRDHLQKASTPGFSFPADGVHSNAIGAPFMDGAPTEAGLKAVAQIVETFLASTDRQIPDVFDQGKADVFEAGQADRRRCAEPGSKRTTSKPWNTR